MTEYTQEEIDRIAPKPPAPRPALSLSRSTKALLIGIPALALSAWQTYPYLVKPFETRESRVQEDRRPEKPKESPAPAPTNQMRKIEKAIPQPTLEQVEEATKILTDEDKAACALYLADNNMDPKKFTVYDLRRYKFVLKKVSGIYGTDIIPLAAMTLKAQEQLKEKGVSESCLTMLQGMRTLNGLANSSFAEGLAAYTMAREKFKSHDIAIGALKGLADGIELHDAAIDNGIKP